jgi:hypothetical protein
MITKSMDSPRDPDGLPPRLQRVLDCDIKADSDPMVRTQHGTACGRSVDGGRDEAKRPARVEVVQPVGDIRGPRRPEEQVAVEACHESDAPQNDRIGRRRGRADGQGAILCRERIVGRRQSRVFLARIRATRAPAGFLAIAKPKGQEMRRIGASLVEDIITPVRKKVTYEVPAGIHSLALRARIHSMRSVCVQPNCSAL